MLAAINFTGRPAASPRPAAARPGPDVRAAAAAAAAAQRRCLALLLVVGVGVRLFHFAYNRSFFIDELFLNVNLIKLSFWQLATQPFAYEQKAPIGYLWAVKALLLVFGNGEQSLRLFSLLGGIGGLFLFRAVARYFLPGWGAVAALAILVFSTPCIYHAVEAKQYGTELLATIVALWLYTRYHARQDWTGLLLWGGLGSALLWFSFSLIFVLAGLALALGLDALLRRQWARLLRYAVPFSLWLLSFGLQYALIISRYHQSGWLIDYFDKVYDGFMPFPLTSGADAQWVARKLYILLLNPLGLLLNTDDLLVGLGSSPLRFVLKMGWLHGLCIGLGGVYLARRRPLLLAMLLLPIGLVLAASALRVYPFHERFTLFLAPLLMLLAGFGIQVLAQRWAHRRAWLYGVLVLFLAPAVVGVGRQLAAPDTFMNTEFNRAAILHINQHYRPGDAVYVFWNMNQAYDYYSLAYPLRYQAVRGSYVKNRSRSTADYLRNLQPDFQRFRGQKRLWFVYDKTNDEAIGDYIKHPAWYHQPGFNAPAYLESHFATLGRKVYQYQHFPYTVVLYELVPARTAPPQLRRPRRQPAQAVPLPAEAN